MYDKPFRTYEEQLEILRTRGVKVPDIAHGDVYNHAINALSTSSYYSLVNGNKLTFNVVDDHFEGNPFVFELQMAHIIYTDFAQLLLKHIFAVETSFKTKLAYLVAEKYGVNLKPDFNDHVDNYLSISHYVNTRKRRVSILKQLVDSYARVIERRPESCTSYYASHKNHVPPWIFLRDLEYGKALQWYKILNDEDRVRIATKMLAGENYQLSGRYSKETAVQFVENGLELLREYRNSFAHSERSFVHNIKVPFPRKCLMSVIPLGSLTKKEHRSGIGDRDAYCCLLVLATLFNDPIYTVKLISDLRTFNNQAENFLKIGRMPKLGINFSRVTGLPDFTLKRMIRIQDEQLERIAVIRGGY